MSEVTSPILTDATGQEIVSKLNTLLTKMDNLAAAFQPNASGIVYSNTTSGLTGDDVQEAVDEMAGDVSEIKQSLSNLGVVNGNYSNSSDTSTTTNVTLKTETLTIPHKSNVLFTIYACIKTASNTGSIILYDNNNNVLCNAQTNSTAFLSMVGSRVVTLDAGTYTLSYKLVAQNGAQATIKGYTTYGYTATIIPTD